MTTQKRKTRNRYEAEFKKEMVRLVLEEGRTIRSVNEEFSLGEELMKIQENVEVWLWSCFFYGKRQEKQNATVFTKDCGARVHFIDEPTSGLDPLMQNVFIELIGEEKKKEKTILLSSHIFDEVEKVCDKVGMIRNGKLIQEIAVDEMRYSQLKFTSIIW